VLYFTIAGEGKPIVFLHGFLESLSMWNYLNLHELTGQKILIDLPGHGNSILQDDGEIPSIDFMAQEVIRVIDNLKLKSYSVVGHSMGGYIGLLLKKIDVRCEKVILLNSNFWTDTVQKKKDRVRVAEIAFKAKKIFIQEAIPNLFGEPDNFPNEINQLMREAMNIPPESIAYASLCMRERNDFTTELNQNPKNFYVIHGLSDRLVETDFIKNQLSSHENLFIIKNAGHMAHIEQPHEVIAILKKILNARS
jgi:pimeloyl-ACP methyl ester carboxylesterase